MCDDKQPPQCPCSQDGCSEYEVSLFLFSSQAANSTPVMHLNRRQDKYQCSQRTPQPCSLPGTHRKRNRPGHFASRSIRAARSDLWHKSHDSLPNTFSPITTRDTRLGTRPTAESVKAARFFWCFEIRRAGLKNMWPYVWPNSGDISSQAFDWAEIPPPAILKMMRYMTLTLRIHQMFADDTAVHKQRSHPKQHGVRGCRGGRRGTGLLSAHHPHQANSMLIVFLIIISTENRGALRYIQAVASGWSSG